MRVISLQSGSNGNCIYVEANGVTLLFDAGIKRIAGPAGHISNFEAAELLNTAASKRMKWACLGHLSQDNNSPKLALATHREILRDQLTLFVATRHEVSGVMEIG